MKRIAIIVNSIGYGGNERSAVNIAKAISNDFEVTIITQEDRGNHYCYKGTVINLDTPCAKTIIGKIINSLKRVARLKRMVRLLELDTIFIILPVSNPINYLGFGCKKIVSCRDCGDLIRQTKKYIMMANSSELIVCNSEYQANYLKLNAPILSKKTRVIYNIVDTDMINYMKTSSVGGYYEEYMRNHKCIISVGRFVKAKGFNELIKAFSIIAKNDESVSLIMIGDGIEKRNIVNLIDELQLQNRVKLLGYQDNPFKFIARSKVFVLSSYSEGFPNVLVEAMACGTPCIATDCESGPSEILLANAQEEYRTGKGGFIIRPFKEELCNWNPLDIREEHKVMAQVVLSLINNEALCNKFSNEALARANDFSDYPLLKKWKCVL